jgi:hypothetical protein
VRARAWLAAALLWAGLSGLARAAEGPGMELVLEPGQERAAARLVGPPGTELGGGWVVVSQAALEDRVRLDVAGPDGRVQVDVLAADAEGSAQVRGRRGAVMGGAALPGGLAEALRAALDGPGVELRWRRLVAARDLELAASEAALLRARLAARLAGDDVGAVAGAEAAEGDVATEVARDLAAGRVDAARLGAWSDAPRVLARAAALAAETGRTELAGALLAQALMAPVADPEALALAAAFGWGGAAADGAPGGGEVPATSGWLLWAGLLLAGALAAGWRGGAWWERVALAVALAASGAMAMWLAGLSPAPPGPPALTDAGLVLGRGAARCELSPPAQTSASWHALVRCPDGAATVRVSRSDAGAPALTTAVLGGAREPGPLLGQWLARLDRDVRAGALDLAPGPQAASDSGALASRIASQRALARAALQLAGPVALLAFLALLALSPHALGDLVRYRRSHAGTGRWLAVAGLLAVLSHTLTPARMVMVYDGYAQTQALIAMEPLRYGAGANWLYAPFVLLRPDHAAVQWANRAWGLVALFALWALAARLWPQRRGVVPLLAMMTATAPLVWRDHASESILVAPTALLLMGVYAVAAARERAFMMLFAAPCLAAAALSRPELGPAGAALSLLVLAAQRPRWPARDWLIVALATLAALCLAPPHIALVRQVVAWLVETDALPGMDGLGARAAQDFFTLGGLRVVTHVGPAALVLLVGASLFARRDAWLAAGLIVVALAWTALTRVDLPDVSIPRVHAPPWLIFALVGALGADVLWFGRASLAGAPVAAPLRALLVAGWLATGALTLAPLYGRTNADAEEALLRAAADALPTGRVCLATLDETDPPPAGKTPRFFPYYLFAARQPAPTLSSLSALSPASPACADGAFALLGMRCYMAIREGATAGPPPPGAPMVAGCQAFRDRHRLTPLLTRDAQNYGDHGFDLYPAGPRLPVGLFRVE